MRAEELRLCQLLDFTPLHPDIEFVAFLRALSQFGFFRFGPITIDVELLEDLLLRTHPRGDGGPEFPPATEDYLRLSAAGWALFKATPGATYADERLSLRTFIRWGEGLPRRVFGELGVSPEDLDRYIEELGHPVAQRGPAEKLYSTEEAGEYLGVHIQTVRAWIRSGKLPASRLLGQKSIRIRASDLERVLEPIDPQQFADE